MLQEVLENDDELSGMCLSLFERRKRGLPPASWEARQARIAAEAAEAAAEAAKVADAEVAKAGAKSGPMALVRGLDGDSSSTEMSAVSPAEECSITPDRYPCEGDDIAQADRMLIAGREAERAESERLARERLEAEAKEEESRELQRAEEAEQLKEEEVVETLLDVYLARLEVPNRSRILASTTAITALTCAPVRQFTRSLTVD